ncbi:hypothetical protein JW752_00570 [Candidatus Peregrinibacteria bacterium]|nr:hypothetical protein [Candidatus Peregrinibacteria bacterium]
MFVNGKTFRLTAHEFGAQEEDTLDQRYASSPRLVRLVTESRERIGQAGLPPDVMQAEIDRFLFRRRMFIKATFNGQSNLKLEELESYTPRLQKASQEFAGLVTRLSQADEPFSAAAEGRLNHVCNGMGKDFVRAVEEYNSELQEAIMILAENVKKAGLDYLMENPDHYNEEAVRHVEKILNLMMSGYYALSEGVLSSLSPDYAAMDLNKEQERQEDKFGSLADPSEKAIDYRRIRELERLMSDEIVAMAENGASDEAIRQELMGFIKMGFKSRMDSIASQNLTLFHKYQPKDAKEANRILDRSDASQQLEFLLSLVNQCLRALPSLRRQGQMLSRERKAAVPLAQ